jgi:hypothetical protein
MACIYYIGNKKYSETELKNYLIEEGGLDALLKVTEEPSSKTGIKNVISKQTRVNLALPDVNPPKLGTDAEVIAEGKKLVDDGDINPQVVVDRINSTNNKSMNVDEAKAMQYHMYQLGVAQDAIIKELSSENLSLEDKATLQGKLGQYNDLLDAATRANILAGTDWGQVGNVRQIQIDKNTFNPSRERAFIDEIYGGEMPADKKAQFDAIVKERNEAISEKIKLEEKLRNAEAELKLKEIKSSKKEKIDHKAKRANLIEELKKAKAEHEQELKDKGIQQMGGIGGIILTPKMVKIIGEIAADYAQEGYEKLEDVVNKVLEDVKDIMPGIDKKDVRDALALHEVQRLEKKAEKLEEKIKSGALAPEYIKLREKFETNTEWVKADQRIINAETKVRKMKIEALNSDRNNMQLAFMWGSKLVRASVLSGVNILYKLASALTIGGGLKRIPEQQIGRVYSKIFKGIAEKAPIEGYTYAKSEAKFYKEFFDYKKFWKNTIQILKEGETDFTKKMGKMPDVFLTELTMPGEQTGIKGKVKKALGVFERAITVPMNLHMVIKDPLKRSTFEASFENGLIWAEKNGLDINDPLVINSIENMAYKRANYEIFMESNKISELFNKQKSVWERSGTKGTAAKFVADFLIPVSTVPTNIVRRLITTSPAGLVRGGLKVEKAYREGVENLKPEEADIIMKQLKQGSLGTALWLTGWFGYAYFGGLYSKFDPNKKRMTGDLSSDEMEIGGKMVPKPIQHALPLEVIQLAATARRIYNNYSENAGKETTEALFYAGAGSIGALSEKIPTISTPVLFVESFGDPYKFEKLKEDMARRFKPQIFKDLGVINGGEMEKFIDKNTSTEGVFRNELKAYDRKGQPIEVNVDQFKKYKSALEEEQKRRLQWLYLNGAPVFDKAANRVVLKKFEDLTPDEKDKAVTHAKTMATKEMKSEFLGEKRQSAKEKRMKSKLEDAMEKEEKKYQKSIK